MAIKWNFVVLVSLEFRLADYVDVVADHTTPAVDRAAPAKHMGRNYHSRHLQCGWVYRRGERSRRLAEWPAPVPFRRFFVGESASARESLCRGLGSRWFTERFDINALVTHFQHG